MDKTTLADIAAKTGVSQPLVSNVLNGKGRCSAQVREQILALLEEAGHRPRIARKPFYHVVAAGTDSVSHAMPLQCGMQAVMMAQRLVLQQYFVRFDDDLGVSEQARVVAAQSPAGVVIDAEKEWSVPFLNEFHALNIPLIQVGQWCGDRRFSAVTVDCLIGTQTAVAELIRRGHRNIGFIRWLPKKEIANSNDKFSGYKAALAEAQIPFRQDLVATVEDELNICQRYERGARQALSGLMGRHNAPTAVVVDNAFLCPQLTVPMSEDNGVLPSWLQAMDLAVFADSNMYGNSVLMSRLLCLPCKSVFLIDPDWEEIGRLAARELLQAARDNHRERIVHALKVQPKLRQPEARFE